MSKIHVACFAGLATNYSNVKKTATWYINVGVASSVQPQPAGG